MSSENRRLQFIQGLRGIAALLILLLHFPAGLWISATGYVGVDLFFVISGFIMVVTTARHGGGALDSIRFIIKRIARIFPTYFVATLLIGTAFYVGLSDDRIFSQDLFKTLVFYPLWEKGAIDAPGWTLNFEMYFYTVFAISLLLRRWRIVALAVVMAFFQCGLPWLLLHKFQPFGPGYGFPAMGIGSYLAMVSDKIIWAFVFGAIVGQIATTSLVITNRTFALGLSSIFFGIALFMMYGIGNTIDHGPWYGALFALAILPLALHEKFETIPIPAPLLFIGDISYSLYITHWVVARFYYERTNIAHQTANERIFWMFVEYAVLVAVVALPIYYFIEIKFSVALRNLMLKKLDQFVSRMPVMSIASPLTADSCNREGIVEGTESSGQQRAA